MKVAVYNTKRHERPVLEAAAAGKGLEFTFLEPRLDEHTAVLANGHEAAVIFVNDAANRETLRRLAAGGTRLLATRRPPANWEST